MLARQLHEACGGAINVRAWLAFLSRTIMLSSTLITEYQLICLEKAVLKLYIGTGEAARL
jgi:hypothetical protein